MNLYLRLLWLLIRLPFMRKQADPLLPSCLTMRVMPSDLDIYLHVNNGRYLTIMDLGRLHSLAVTGLLKVIRQKHWKPALGSAKVHFVRPLRVFQKFMMTTQLIYWDEKWFYIEQKIFRKEALHVIALFKVLFLDDKGKVPVDTILLHVAPSVKKPMMPHHLKAWLEAEKASRLSD